MTGPIPSTFVLIPGAWMGSWVWDEVAAELRTHGHTVHAPTLAGLQAGSHRASNSVRLATHVDQILSLLDSEDLSGVVLVGHSYSGLIAGQVADRQPARVSHTVFVQAFLPRDGRSPIDDWSDDRVAREQEIADLDAHGGTWPAPITGLDAEADLSPAQRAWLAGRFVDHPGHTVTDPALMAHRVETLSATYIASLPDDTQPLPPHVVALQSEPSWTVERIRADTGRWCPTRRSWPGCLRAQLPGALK
jgi:pimeloyl-ACP methyl ester carboxylesterase